MKAVSPFSMPMHKTPKTILPSNATVLTELPMASKTSTLSTILHFTQSMGLWLLLDLTEDIHFGTKMREPSLKLQSLWNSLLLAVPLPAMDR